MKYAISFHTLNGKSAGFHSEVFSDGLLAERAAEVLEKENPLILTTVVPWVSRKGPELFPVRSER